MPEPPRRRANRPRWPWRRRTSKTCVTSLLHLLTRDRPISVGLEECAVSPHPPSSAGKRGRTLRCLRRSRGASIPEPMSNGGEKHDCQTLHPAWRTHGDDEVGEVPQHHRGVQGVGDHALAVGLSRRHEFEIALEELFRVEGRREPKHHLQLLVPPVRPHMGRPRRDRRRVPGPKDPLCAVNLQANDTPADLEALLLVRMHVLGRRISARAHEQVRLGVTAVCVRPLDAELDPLLRDRVLDHRFSSSFLIQCLCINYRYTATKVFRRQGVRGGIFMGTSERRRYDSSGRLAEAAARRARMVEAARRLFIAHGYGSTTIAQIAEEAGVSAELIYASFGTKKALLFKVHEAALAGDTEEIPLLQRELARAIQEETSQERQRFEDIEALVAAVARLGPLRHEVPIAGDIIYALPGPDVYLQLVRDRQWSPEQYENWLATALMDNLVPSKH